MFWQLFRFANDHADHELRQALTTDIGTVLGGKAALFFDVGLHDASSIYAFLSPSLREDFVQALGRGLKDVQRDRFAGVLDVSMNQFARRTVPDALAVIRRRRPALRRDRQALQDEKSQRTISPDKARRTGLEKSSSEELRREKRAETLKLNKQAADEQEAKLAERIENGRFYQDHAGQVTIEVTAKASDGSQFTIRTRSFHNLSESNLDSQIS